MSTHRGGQPLAGHVEVARADRVLTRWLADGVLLLAAGSSTSVPVALRGTGAELWLALDRPITVDAVAAVLADRYDVDDDVVAADVRAALGDLVELQVIDVRDPTDGITRSPSALGEP